MDRDRGAKAITKNKLFEIEALLSLLEMVDIEQIDPAHHQQVVQICIEKLRAINRLPSEEKIF